MNQTTVDKGRASEAVAALHLKARGYRILCCNFRVNRYEIDLVAKKGDCLVFIEFKTRKITQSDIFAHPSRGQTRRLVYAAHAFIKTSNIKAQSCRFDLIRVLTDKNSVKVERLEDAFDSSAFLI